MIVGACPAACSSPSTQPSVAYRQPFRIRAILEFLLRPASNVTSGCIPRNDHAKYSHQPSQDFNWKRKDKLVKSYHSDESDWGFITAENEKLAYY